MSKGESTSDGSFFTLQLSANSSFSSRCKDTFASLGALEKQHDAHERSNASSRRAEQNLIMKADPDDDTDIKFSRSSDFAHGRSYRDSGMQKSGFIHSNRWRGRNERVDKNRDPDHDGFQQPQRRPPRRPFRVPEYKKNPGKWTCYSLEDVNNGDMSEKGNKRAAFEFLAERKKARDKECDQNREKAEFEVGETACSKGIISFCKPKALHSSSSHKDAPGVNLDSAVTLEKKKPYKDNDYLKGEEMEDDDSASKCSLSSDTDPDAEKPDTNHTKASFKRRKKVVCRNIRQRDSDG